eukprot:SAG31_NODE_2043_length_6582_cov_2.798952_9_plen_95_part_00
MLPFDLAAAKLLESEFSKFKAGGPSVITLPLGTGEYDVDFAVMEQINRKTKFRRAIKREVRESDDLFSLSLLLLLCKQMECLLISVSVGRTTES